MSSPREEARNASINPSATLKTSVSIYLPVLGIGLLLFECVRRRFRRAYDSRGVGGNAFWTYSAQQSQSERLFGWIPTVFRATEDEILERCGLDTLCYLRFLRMGQRVALLAVVLSIALFPLYATATPPPTTRTRVDPLERITMSNLATGDWRLWASLVANYIITTFMMLQLLKEYQSYVKRRHQLLSQTEAAVYTVLINDLPLKLRTRQTLEQYMRKVFPDSIRSVYVAVECARLEELVEERETTRNALEHALAMAEKENGTRPKHREGGSWRGEMLCQRGSRGELVDSIDFYQERLAKLNEMVSREICSIGGAQRQLARQVEEQEHGDVRPPPTMTPTEEQQLAVRIEAGAQQDTHHYHQQQQQQQHISPVSNSSNNSSHVAINMGSHTRSGSCSVASPTARVNSSQHHHTLFDLDHDEEQEEEEKEKEDEASSVAGSGKEQELTAREESRRLHPIRVMRRAAFISFTSLMSTQVAQQTLQSSNPVAMATTPAPLLEDVNWSNVGHQYRTRAMGRLVAAALTATIVVFWTVPTAFVTSLATVESLRRQLPFLNKAFDQHPWLEEISKQIAPLALVGLNALAPLIFGLLSSREGYASNSEVRAAVFTKLAYFQLIQIFFVTVVVGTVLDSLKEIVDQPKTLISMLGRSMPQQSTFFMTYVIVRTGLSLTLELLRVVPLLLALLFKCLAPQLTRRERNATWYGLCAISNTEPFDPTAQFADAFLAMLVTLTFSSIAPLVCYFTGVFFCFAELIYRRQVLFVYRASTHSMGAYWPRLYVFLIVALVVAQLTLLGLLSLKKAPVPSLFAFALVVIILLFHHYTSELYPRVAKYLPLTECVHLDEERTKQGDPQTTFAFLDNVYRQPAMSQNNALRVDYQMLEQDFADHHERLVSSPEMNPEDQRLFAK